MDIENESTGRKLFRILLVLALLLGGTGIGVYQVFFAPYTPSTPIYCLLVVAAWAVCISGGKTMIKDYLEARKRKKEGKE